MGPSAPAATRSAATIRGTDWTVTDRCDGTLATVRRGTVRVRDFGLHPTETGESGRSQCVRLWRFLAALTGGAERGVSGLLREPHGCEGSAPSCSVSWTLPESSRLGHLVDVGLLPQGTGYSS